jgi:hypothetical protein
MPTPFANVVFYVITALNTAGQLAAVDKSELPAGQAGPILFSEGQCRMVIGKMTNPEKYVCQPFSSPKSTQWTYRNPAATEAIEGAPSEPAPQVPQPEHRSDLEGYFDDIQLAGGYYRYPLWAWVENDSTVAEKDRPYLEPRVEPPSRNAAEPPPPAASPKVTPAKRAVVVHRQQQQPQHRHRFDPIGTIVSLLTPRDW